MAFEKRHIPWNKGRKEVYSEETLRLMKILKQPYLKTEEIVTLYKQGNSCNDIAKLLNTSFSTVHRRLKPLGILRDKGSSNRGKPKSKEHRLKIKLSNRKTFSKSEWVDNRKGENNSFYGYKHDPETIRVMKEKLSVLLSGSNNPQWLGGLSFESYRLEFNDKLKDEIRERDRFKCQICDISQFDLGYKLIVHHKDYNKGNNLPLNLTSLCRNCHMKTNFNREDWREHFLLKENKIELIHRVAS